MIRDGSSVLLAGQVNEAASPRRGVVRYASLACVVSIHWSRLWVRRLPLMAAKRSTGGSSGSRTRLETSATEMESQREAATA